jgi:Flp pilus assembly protein TadG
MCSLLRQREDGQALVLVTLVLTFLIMLILTCIEVGGRYLELAEIEDALK